MVFLSPAVPLSMSPLVVCPPFVPSLSRPLSSLLMSQSLLVCSCLCLHALLETGERGSRLSFLAFLSSFNHSLTCVCPGLEVSERPCFGLSAFQLRLVCTSCSDSSIASLLIFPVRLARVSSLSVPSLYLSFPLAASSVWPLPLSAVQSLDLSLPPLR